jgi:hypothetical protein
MTIKVKNGKEVELPSTLISLTNDSKLLVKNLIGTMQHLVGPWLGAVAKVLSGCIACIAHLIVMTR